MSTLKGKEKQKFRGVVTPGAGEERVGGEGAPWVFRGNSGVLLS